MNKFASWSECRCPGLRKYSWITLEDKKLTCESVDNDTVEPVERRHSSYLCRDSETVNYLIVRGRETVEAQ